MTLSTIPKSERAAILEKCRDIPPLDLRDHLSPEGKRIWDNIKFEYRLLHAELSAFFAGERTVLTSLDSDSEDDKKRYLQLRRNQILSFYALIRDSWEHLKPHYGTDKHGNKLTPGQLLAAILDMEWRGKLIPAVTGYCTVNPRKSYELRTKTRKIKDKGFGSGSLALRQLEKDVGAHLGEFAKAAALEVAVLSHCRAAAKVDDFVKDSLDTFDMYSQKLENYIYREFDFRKGKTQTWERGSRKTP